MHAVAIGPGVGDVDAVAAAVALAVGRSPAEIRRRITLVGEDPIVLGVQRDAAAATSIVTALRDGGFEALALAVHQPVTDLVLARDFVLDDERLRVESRDHRRAELPFAEVDAIVIGRSYAQPTAPREAPVPPGLGSAMADQLFHAMTTVKVTPSQPSHEGVAYVFAATHACALREHELLYQSFGADLQLSRGANFRQLVQRLRERCPHAVYDERLLRPARASHILGPMFAVDVHLELAAALVAATVRRAVRGPYR